MSQIENPAMELAKAIIESGSIQFSPEKPFTWASGSLMPVYNDNRRLLGNYKYRELVAHSFDALIRANSIQFDCIAGVATAGIPHATTLANLLKTPLIYIRTKAKEHGMGNQIEGVLRKNQKVLVIEDLISTGGSAINAIQAVREQGCHVSHCFSIFSYGFKRADDAFRDIECENLSLLNFKQLLEYAKSIGTIDQTSLKSLKLWYDAPFSWTP